MAMSARPGENLKKKKKKKILDQANFFFLKRFAGSEYHWITTLNTERHKITRSI